MPDAPPEIAMIGAAGCGSGPDPTQSINPTRRAEMERRRFGATEYDVPVIGQGTWYIDSGDRAAAIAALRRGLDLGMTHIDTAEMYGAAELVVGEGVPSSWRWPACDG